MVIFHRIKPLDKFLFQVYKDDVAEKDLQCAQANERCDRHLDQITKLRQEIKDGLEDRKLSEKKGLTMVSYEG